MYELYFVNVNKFSINNFIVIMLRQLHPYYIVMKYAGTLLTTLTHCITQTNKMHLFKTNILI